MNLLKPVLGLAILTAALPAWGQNAALSLGSGSAQPGGSVSLPLTLSSSNAQAASLMWTFAYAPSDIQSVNVTLGAAASAAGKSVECVPGASGQSVCVLMGMNQTGIANGVVANATFTLAPAVTASNTSVQVLNPITSSASGDAVVSSSAGGSVSVTRTVALSSVTCNPASLTAPASAQCTVALTAPATAAFPVTLGYSASGASVSVPSSVTVASGASSANFTLQANSATSATTVQITASAGGITKTASVAVAPQGSISVAVAPSTTTLSPGQARQFAATVSGTSNTAVRWSISPQVGTISASGLYTAPASVASQQTVTVRATSQASSTRYGTATVVVNPTASADTTAPVISSVRATPSSTSAVITWTTNEAATGTVDYAKSDATTPSSASHTSRTLSHSVTLSNLTAGTLYYFRVVSADAAGNSAATEPVTFTTTAATSGTVPSGTYSMFAASAPAQRVDSDGASVELGMKFSATAAGYVTGARFYKGSSYNRGTHTATLWSASGQKLASATFTGETSTGWQTVKFATPVRIAAGTTYVISYHAPYGRYSVAENYFGAAASNGPLRVPAAAGVYRYGSTAAFPTSTYNNSNYFVDVIFTN